MSAAAAARVCQACGLCCDGTLFTVIPLGPSEVVSARLPVFVREDGSRAVRQRCAALEGTRCSAYEARPAACRRFECALYAAVSEGEVDEVEARAIVDQARGGSSGVRARFFGKPIA